MIIDVDYHVGLHAIKKIKRLFVKYPKGKRQQITDEIINFSEELERKFKIN